jgi:hypothetical protein
MLNLGSVRVYYNFAAATGGDKNMLDPFSVQAYASDDLITWDTNDVVCRQICVTVTVLVLPDHVSRVIVASSMRSMQEHVLMCRSSHV